MQSLYEILKTSKLGAGSAPDMYTALMSQKMGGGGGSVIEYTGAVPTTITANGKPLLAWTISGNMQQTGTPTHQNPITPQETGDLVTSGEHAGQYKIPISSGNTTTPVYLGAVQSTRRIKKLVLTGEEQVLIHQTIVSWFQIFLSDIVINNLELCTHYKPSPSSAANIQNGEILVQKQAGSDEGRIVIRDTAYTTADDFKTYLQQQYAAGTPVTVWYVLANETTGIVNEPLRKIGDYADTISNVAEIPTTAGEQTFDVDTSLKPSEVYIKYRGG